MKKIKNFQHQENFRKIFWGQKTKGFLGFKNIRNKISDCDQELKFLTSEDLLK